MPRYDLPPAHTTRTSLLVRAELARIINMSFRVCVSFDIFNPFMNL
jgi:hypothetical protein